MYMVISDLANTYPIALGAASLYTNNSLTTLSQTGIFDFISSLYQRIHRPWIEIAQSHPPLNIDVKLPPLIAIVLSRASTREQIPEVLKELREELNGARKELNFMNEMLDSSVSQAEIYAQVNRLNESYNAIVAESLLTNSERWQRRIASVINFVRPIRQLYSIAADPLNVDQKTMEKMFKDTHSAVKSSSRIVSRSIAAATISELLRVDSIRNIVLSHFSDGEIKTLSRGDNCTTKC